MVTTGAAREKQTELPRSATITVSKQKPSPTGEVEVAPEIGRIHFHNKDDREYRLRFWKPKTDPNAGIDILLPSDGSVTVLIKTKDEWLYRLIDIGSGDVLNGAGGGPIRN